MKHKTKKQRLAIAKKAKATRNRNTKSTIRYLESQLQQAQWRIDWITEAFKSNNDQWIATVKDDLAPDFLKDIGNSLTSGILPAFNRQLRAAMFDGEPKQYSFEWWLIDTGKKLKPLSWAEVFGNVK